MNITIFFILIIILIIGLLLLTIKKNKKNFKPLSFLLLKEYVLQFNKKRKHLIIGRKKHNKTTNLSKKPVIIYKKLNKIYLSKKYTKLIKSKIKTYVERLNYKKTIEIYKIFKESQTLINKNKETFRSLNNECLIETVAKSFTHSILVKNNFNIFQHFEELTQIVNVYKKEAKILNVLIVNNLSKLYLMLLNDIYFIKKYIKKGATTKKVKSLTKKHPAFIYGIYLLNPKSTKFLLNKKELIIKSTSIILTELDEILNKQKYIYNYINFLYRIA